MTSPSFLERASLKAVVFGGGGARGWAFLGALTALRNELDVDWGARRPALEWAAGTSIGALSALAIVLGFSIDEITEFLSHTNEADLMSMNPALLLSPTQALNDGSAMRALISRMIEMKLGVGSISLGSLAKRTGMKLAVVAYDLNRGGVLVLSSTGTPQVSTTEAVYASLAVPLLFAKAQILMPRNFVSSKSLDENCASQDVLSPSTAETCASSSVQEDAKPASPKSYLDSFLRSHSLSTAADADAYTDTRLQHAATFLDSSTEIAEAAMEKNEKLEKLKKHEKESFQRRRLQHSAAFSAALVEARKKRAMVAQHNDGLMLLRRLAQCADVSMERVVCVDGGLGDNLPIRLFAPGSAVAFRLDWTLEAVNLAQLNGLAPTLLRVFTAAMQEACRAEWASLDETRRQHVVSLQTGTSPMVSATAEEAVKVQKELKTLGYKEMMHALHTRPDLVAKLLHKT